MCILISMHVVCQWRYKNKTFKLILIGYSVLLGFKLLCTSYSLKVLRYFGNNLKLVIILYWKHFLIYKTFIPKNVMYKTQKCTGKWQTSIIKNAIKYCQLLITKFWFISKEDFNLCLISVQIWVKFPNPIILTISCCVFKKYN